MITFRTPTILDIRAATTLGVNVKVNDNPFGFFGTGLKFAIAVLLRERCSITILTAGETYRFSSRTTSIRGKDFSIVCMNGQELGFTTEFGKNWQRWMAYRELYCNTMDEGGDVVVGSVEGGTTIQVEGLDEIHRNRHEFILTQAPDHSDACVDVIFRSSNKVFYKGIAVFTSPRPLVYTYNIKEKIDLTEERTAKNSWEVENWVLSALTDPSFPAHRLRAAVTTKDSLEQTTIRFPSYYGDDNFWKTVGAIIKTGVSDINLTLVKAYEERCRTRLKDTIEEFEPSSIQRASFERARDFVESLGFDVSSYDIRFAKRIGSNVLGAAIEGKIYLLDELFRSGNKDDCRNADRGVRPSSREPFGQ